MSAHRNHQQPEFRHLREVVLWLHDYKDYLDKQPYPDLEVHHLNKNSKDHNLFNLVPVCKKNHVYLGRLTKLPPLTKEQIKDLLLAKIYSL